MPQPDDQLIEQFARLGFSHKDLASRIREIDPTLAECSIQFRDARTLNPGDFFQFSFEFWREKREDPLTITCLSAALIGPGPSGQEELLANEYYHIAQRLVPPKEEVIASLIDLQRRQRVNQKFKVNGKISNQRRRRKPPREVKTAKPPTTQKRTIMISKSVCSKQVAPTIQDIKIYFSQKGIPEVEAESFFQFQEKRQWAGNNGDPLPDWKSSARRRIDALIQNQPWLFQRSVR